MTLSENYYCIVHCFLSDNKQVGDHVSKGFKHFPVIAPTASNLNVIVTVIVVTW